MDGTVVGARLGKERLTIVAKVGTISRGQLTGKGGWASATHASNLFVRVARLRHVSGNENDYGEPCKAVDTLTAIFDRWI